MKWTILLATCCALLSEIVKCISVRHYLEEEGALSPKLVRFSFNKHQGKSFTSSTGLAKRDNGVTFDLKNEQNFYSIRLSVGTPGQEVVVLLDTGSSDLWIPGSDNPYCKDSSVYSMSSQYKENEKDKPFQTLPGGITATKPSGGSRASGTIDCNQFGTFNNKESRTFHSNDTRFSVSYGDTSYAEGTWGYDSINIGNVSLANVSMGIANLTNSSVGILGIGLSNLENTYTGVENVKNRDTHKYLNFPMMLKAQGLIEKNVYSLFLNRKRAYEGSILFGAVDHSKYTGQLYTVPMLNLYKQQGLQAPLQLQVTLQGVGLKGGNVTNTTSTTPVPALLDSGTTLVYLPDKMVTMLADQLNANWDRAIGYYVTDCSNVDNTELYFNFGGFNIASNMSSYVIGRSGNNRCVIGLQSGGPDSAILGDMFMQHAYIVFDLEDFEISMAQANYAGGEEQLETITKEVPSAKKAPGYSHTFSGSQSITRGGDIFHSTSYGSSSGSSTTTRTWNGRNAAADLAPAPMLAFFAHFIYSFLM
ncbi:hypothetical protein ZYGR_0AV01150 [Zygosaccharomyces rouxii]|uniref:Peptidase A1 domain-containing protein n=1 Tax=Zygosaccharomyces rouxii TaxID=4956 RepID=A0A1Q3AID2_ZYGRO|nr:hypothetical protein ZYGR_0AV01150 [Zygosaccharomyces rouxii]